MIRSSNGQRALIAVGTGLLVFGSLVLGMLPAAANSQSAPHHHDDHARVGPLDADHLGCGPHVDGAQHSADLVDRPHGRGGDDPDA